MKSKLNSEEESREFFEKYGMRILMSLRRIIRAVDVYSRKLNQEFKLTSPQLICLYSIEKSGPITLSGLAREVNIGASTVNGIIDRLENKKLVKRTRDSRDRRRVLIEITQEGHHVAARAPSLLQDRFASNLRKLNELEQATIALSLENVISMMEAENLDASPNLIPSAHVVETNKELT